jgi:hypothetical protein
MAEGASETQILMAQLVVALMIAFASKAHCRPRTGSSASMLSYRGRQTGDPRTGSSSASPVPAWQARPCPSACRYSRAPGALSHPRERINMARSPRSQRALARHRGAAGGSKDTPPVGQVNGHHSLGRLYKITQNAGRRYVIGESDRHKRRALLLRHAELYAPAEQQPRDDPMLAYNAGDRRSRLRALHRDRELLFVAEEAPGRCGRRRRHVI